MADFSFLGTSFAFYTFYFFTKPTLWVGGKKVNKMSVIMLYSV